MSIASHPAAARWIAPHGLNDFAVAYPGASAKVEHQLQDHPLFAIDALADLAGRLPASHVEHSRGDLKVNQDSDAIGQVTLDAPEIVRSIADNGCWMVLKKVDADPAYAALIDQCLAEIADVTQPATGPYRRREAFIFLSSPNSVTPFHMDPEHNILLQIAGQKTMRIYPAGRDDIVPQTTHEAFHQGGRHRNMPHRDAFDAAATDYVMRAGDGVYVPVKAPHWVQNGAVPSVSFSITWRSDMSDGEARLHRFNAGLRRLGITPGVAGAHPARDAAKIAAHRAAKRLTLTARRLLGRERERAAY